VNSTSSARLQALCCAAATISLSVGSLSFKGACAPGFMLLWSKTIEIAVSPQNQQKEKDGVLTQKHPQNEALFGVM